MRLMEFMIGWERRTTLIRVRERITKGDPFRLETNTHRNPLPLYQGERRVHRLIGVENRNGGA